MSTSSQILFVIDYVKNNSESEKITTCKNNTINFLVTKNKQQKV